MNEKGALALADRFELVRARFKERVERAWQHLEPNPVSLREAIPTVRELNHLFRQEGLGEADSTVKFGRRFRKARRKYPTGFLLALQYRR